MTSLMMTSDVSFILRLQSERDDEYSYERNNKTMIKKNLDKS